MKLATYRFCVEVLTNRLPSVGRSRLVAEQGKIKRRAEEIRDEQGSLTDSVLRARAEWLKTFVEGKR